MKLSALYLPALFVTSTALAQAPMPPGWTVLEQSLSSSNTDYDSARLDLSTILNAGTLRVILRTERVEVLLFEMMEVANFELTKNKKSLSATREVIVEKFSQRVLQTLNQTRDASDRQDIFLSDLLTLIGDTGWFAAEEGVFREAMLVSEYLFSIAFLEFGHTKDLDHWLYSNFSMGAAGYAAREIRDGAAMMLGARGEQEVFDKMAQATERYRPGPGLFNLAMHFMAAEFNPTINPKWITMRALKNDFLRSLPVKAVKYCARLLKGG